jgi:hypothetical protein
MLTNVQILHSLDILKVLMSGWNTRQGCAQLERETHHLDKCQPTGSCATECIVLLPFRAIEENDIFILEQT